MKFLASMATFLLSMLSVSTPATAQHDGARGREFMRGAGAGELQRPFLRRQEPKRSDTAHESIVLRESGASASASPTSPAEELKPIHAPALVPGQTRERLSLEERRQLRRDINAAGRDIYRRNRPE